MTFSIVVCVGIELPSILSILIMVETKVAAACLLLPCEIYKTAPFGQEGKNSTPATLQRVCFPLDEEWCRRAKSFLDWRMVTSIFFKRVSDSWIPYILSG